MKRKKNQTTRTHLTFDLRDFESVGVKVMCLKESERFNSTDKSDKLIDA